MASIEELRAEARRLREAADNVSDLQTKRELASRALELSQRAEAMAAGMGNAEILRANIERYRSLLSSGHHSGNLSDEQRQLVTEMLDDAEALLADLSKKAP
jgi:hypothetical protein